MIEARGNSQVLDPTTMTRRVSERNRRQDSYELSPIVHQHYSEMETDHQSLGLNPGSKRTEVGFLNSRKPMTVYLFSERFPLWLLALDGTWCLRLIIVGAASLSDFVLLCTVGERDILNQLLAPFINRNSVSFLPLGDDIKTEMEPKDTTLLLISGGLYSFLLPKLERYPDVKALAIADEHCPGRLRNGKPTSHDAAMAQQISRLRYTKWLRLRHSTTGGSTDFVALLAYVNIETFPQASSFQRGIRHVFTSGPRPGPLQPVVSPHFGIYYCMDDRLVPGLYHLPVECESHFHATGLGSRALSTEELATAHGFARQLVFQNFPVHMLDYPPCQLLTASLDPVFVKEVYVSDSNPAPLKRIKDSHQTYFPELKRHLAHSWIDVSLITATASKADNAELPSRLWDSRLELVFPGSLPFLDFLRRRILQLHRKRLLREVRRYLSVTFGTNWATELVTQRKLISVGSLRSHQGGVRVRVSSRIFFV